ncbi:TPA: hypothetical protein P9G18_000047 [Pseudomonas aeruginosa]|nr:hypothetical protein [Pseudomonas aeruginosa]
MTKANECTCPSGDGSLRWPCPAHPAVEQAGGDELEKFLAWANKEYEVEEGYELNESNTSVLENKKGWMARAALAQPSTTLPPFAEKVLAKLRRFYDCASDFESGGVDIGRHWLDLLTQLGLLNRVQRSPALWEISQQGEDLLGTPQPSPASDLDPFNLAPHAEAFNEAPAEALKPGQAEAERPEVVAYRTIGRHTKHQHPHYALNYYKQNAEDQAAHWRERGCEVSEDELMTVAQHERITAQLHDALDESDGDRWKLRSERDAALARVAELEKQEPVAWMHDQPNRVDVIHRDVKELLQRVPGSNRGIHRPLDVSEHYTIPLYAAPVAQTQQLHDLDKQCRDDVARALGLRPSQERGFAWSYLLASIKSCVKASEDAAQAQHSVPEEFIGRLSEFLAQRGATGKSLLRELRTMLAAVGDK